MHVTAYAARRIVSATPFAGLLERAYAPTATLRCAALNLLAPMVWRVAAARARLGPRAVDDTRHVLIAARTRLAVYYGVNLARLLAGEPGVRIHVTCPPHLREEAESLFGEVQAACAFVGLADALTRLWDQICFPLHYYGQLFHPRASKVFVNHGIETGKHIFGRQHYAYGFKALLARGKTYYDAMLATSPWEEELAAASDPAAYSGKIAVTAEASACRLDELRGQREALRARLQIGRGERAVLFMSSWGPSSLLASCAPLLSEAARALAGKGYRLFLASHANNLDDAARLGDLRRLAFAGVELVPAGTSHWMEYAVAADAGVSDVTSMSLYFARLGHPLAYVPIATDSLQRGSPIFEVRASAGRISPAAPWAGQLESLVAADGGAVAETAARLLPRVADAEHLRGVLRASREAKRAGSAKAP
jgi:hypothetical protein